MKPGRANPLGSIFFSFRLLFMAIGLDITQTCVHNIENIDFYMVRLVVNYLQG
jgi:hypothetical protein